MVSRTSKHAFVMPPSHYTALHPDASIPPAAPLASPADSYTENEALIWLSTRSYTNTQQATQWQQDIELIAQPLRGDFAEMTSLSGLALSGNQFAQQALEYSLRLFIAETARDDSLIDQYKDWSLGEGKIYLAENDALEKAFLHLSRHTEVYEFLELLAIKRMWPGTMILSVSPRWKKIAFPNRTATLAEARAQADSKTASDILDSALQSIDYSIHRTHLYANELADLLIANAFIQNMAVNSQLWIQALDELTAEVKIVVEQEGLTPWYLKEILFERIFREPGLENEVAKGFEHLKELIKSNPRALYHMASFACADIHEAREALCTPLDHKDLRAHVTHDDFDLQTILFLNYIGGWDKSIFKVFQSLSLGETAALLSKSLPGEIWIIRDMLQRSGEFDFTVIDQVESLLFPIEESDASNQAKDRILKSTSAVVIPFNQLPDDE